MAKHREDDLGKIKLTAPEVSQIDAPNDPYSPNGTDVGAWSMSA
jgi:hypothetical protein